MLSIAGAYNENYQLKFKNPKIYLVIIMIIASILPKISAADIDFGGQYTKHHSSEEYFCLGMNQYPSPKGKEKGNFIIWYGYTRTGLHPWYEGRLDKIGKNTYQYQDGEVKIVFKVHKQKVVVKGNKYCDDSISGTYQLKHRFYYL